MDPSHDPLDSLLERCRRDEAPPCAPLQQEVWRRIAHSERPPSVRPWRWIDWESVFARPSFAAAFVMACVLAGLLTAEIRASHLAAVRSTELQRSYWRLVDPLLETNTETAPPIPPPP